MSSESPQRSSQKSFDSQRNNKQPPRNSQQPTKIQSENKKINISNDQSNKQIGSNKRNESKNAKNQQQQSDLSQQLSQQQLELSQGTNKDPDNLLNDLFSTSSKRYTMKKRERKEQDKTIKRTLFGSQPNDGERSYHVNENKGDSNDGSSDTNQRRVRKNKDQILALQKAYEKSNGNWSKDQQRVLAEQLGLSEQQVYKWSWDQIQKRRKYDTRKQTNAPFKDQQCTDEFGGYSKSWLKGEQFSQNNNIPDEQEAMDSISQIVGINIEQKAKEIISKKSPEGLSKRKVVKPINSSAFNIVPQSTNLQTISPSKLKEQLLEKLVKKDDQDKVSSRLRSKAYHFSPQQITPNFKSAQPKLQQYNDSPLIIQPVLNEPFGKSPELNKLKLSNSHFNNINDTFKIGDLKSIMSTPDRPFKMIGDCHDKIPKVSILDTVLMKKEHFGLLQTKDPKNKTENQQKIKNAVNNLFEDVTENFDDEILNNEKFQPINMSKQSSYRFNITPPHYQQMADLQNSNYAIKGLATNQFMKDNGSKLFSIMSNKSFTSPNFHKHFLQ